MNVLILDNVPRMLVQDMSLPMKRVCAVLHGFIILQLLTVDRSSVNPFMICSDRWVIDTRYYANQPVTVVVCYALFHTVPPGETWDPPNSTAPLYHENYDTIFNDVGLQNRLIQHIGEERYRNFTEPVTHIGPDTDGITVPSGDALLLGPGCQGDPLVTERYPNVTTTSAITTSFLNQIECGATFSWGNRIPFFFPPHLTHIQCNNALATL